MSPAEEPMVRRLSTGGNGIRTVGSAGEVPDASCVRCPLCWHPLPLQKPKERTLVGPAEALPTGRHHPGTPSEIKSECRARSSRIRKRLPPESAGMPFWRSMFRRKRRKAVARNFQAARHDATKLTKALPEPAPPTSKGCRRLAASSRLAEQCSAVSSCDSALPAHYSSGLASGRGHDKHRTRRLATILIHARLPSTPSESWQTKSPTWRASARQ